MSTLTFAQYHPTGNIVLMLAYSSKVNIYLYWGIEVAECNAVCIIFCKR